MLSFFSVYPGYPILSHPIQPPWPTGYIGGQKSGAIFKVCMQPFDTIIFLFRLVIDDDLFFVVAISFFPSRLPEKGAKLENLFEFPIRAKLTWVWKQYSISCFSHLNSGTLLKAVSRVLYKHGCILYIYIDVSWVLYKDHFCSRSQRKS